MKQAKGLNPARQWTTSWHNHPIGYQKLSLEHHFYIKPMKLFIFNHFFLLKKKTPEFVHSANISGQQRATGYIRRKCNKLNLTPFEEVTAIIYKKYTKKNS